MQGFAVSQGAVIVPPPNETPPQLLARALQADAKKKTVHRRALRPYTTFDVKAVHQPLECRHYFVQHFYCHATEICCGAILGLMEPVPYRERLRDADKEPVVGLLLCGAISRSCGR